MSMVLLYKNIILQETVWENISKKVWVACLFVLSCGWLVLAAARGTDSPESPDAGGRYAWEYVLLISATR
jgi:hypothetical protein